MKRKDYLILAGILLVHLLLLIYLKFTAWPEMSLWPYLITKGWMPYRDIAIAHTPLMLFDLALFYKIFGIGVMQLKVFTWVLILFSDVLVFTLTRKLWDKKVAFFSLVTYVLWLLFYDGNGLWFDFYMGILAFCSFYFARQKKWVWTGVFWALAFISKQTAVWFLVPILFEIINIRPLKGNPLKMVARFAIGALVIALPFTLLLFIFHLLPYFWDWAVNFGVFILPKSQGQIQLPDIKTLFASLFPFVIFLPLIVKSKKYLILALWAAAGMLGTYPRFEYFHFQPAVFYLTIGGSLILFERRNLLTKIFIAIYLLGSVYLVSTYLVKNLNEGTRFYENEVTEVVDYVKYNTKKGERIFVLNYWDNIYALTETLPSTNPWVPQLSWYMEELGIQEEMVEDLENNPPKLVIYNPYTESGLSSYIPKKVYDYIMENYSVDRSIENIKILVAK